MMNRVKFIYNPLSGENKIVATLDYIIEQYQKNGYEIVPYRISPNYTIENAIKSIDDSYHHILAAGGDGTINGVVNAMKNHGIETPLAVLPAGTANDFAKMLGFDNSLKIAICQILSGKIEQVDIGKVNSQYFINVLSSGLFTDISQKTPAILKNTFGKLAYYFSSIQDLPSFRKINIKIDSNEVIYNDNALIIFVFNGKTAGNIDIAHRSIINDGYLDVLIVKGDNIIDTINTGFHFFMDSGSDREYPKGVIYFKTKKVDISSIDSLYVDIDGELGPKLPITVECISKGLRVIVPKK